MEPARTLMAEWKPNRWSAASLSLFLNPFGMLYLQRPALALGYFLLNYLFGMAVFGANFLGLNKYVVVTAIATWAVGLICAVHSYRLASGAEPTTLRKWYSRWYGIVGVAMTTFLCIFGFRAFLYEPFHVPSSSMHLAIPEDSTVFASKWGFGHYGTYGIYPFPIASTAKILRGDVVIHRQQPGNLNYIRRVVAVPGDHIEYRNRHMTLNGQPVPFVAGNYDGYYQHATETIGDQTVQLVFIPERLARDYDQVVPPDQFVMFGDSRDNSRDSRFLGMVKRDDIRGRVVKVFRPSE
jgi:signal peptidase I